MVARTLALLLACALTWSGLVLGAPPTSVDLAPADPAPPSVLVLLASGDATVHELLGSDPAPTAASEHVADAQEGLSPPCEVPGPPLASAEPAAPARAPHRAPCLEGPQRPPDAAPLRA